jgi:hypothetical protein
MHGGPVASSLASLWLASDAPSAGLESEATATMIGAAPVVMQQIWPAPQPLPMRACPQKVDSMSRRHDPPIAAHPSGPLSSLSPESGCTELQYHAAPPSTAMQAQPVQTPEE